MKIILRKWWKIVKSCRESLRAPSNVAKNVKNEMVLTSKRTKIAENAKIEMSHFWVIFKQSACVI